MQDGGSVAGLAGRRRPPQDHTVLTGLGERQSTKPLHTVHIVAVDVAR